MDLALSWSKQVLKGKIWTALAAGGAIYKEPQDHGFTYGHGFGDLDGHIWELIAMQSEAMQQV